VYTIEKSCFSALDGLEPFQSQGWAEAKKALGWMSYVFCLKLQGSVVSHVLVLVRKIVPGLYIGYIPFGPVGNNSLEMESALKPYLSDLSYALGQQIHQPLIFLQWDFPFGTEIEGFHLIKPLTLLSESTQPTGTWVLSLSSGYENIVKGYHKRAKRALKKNNCIVTIEEWDGSDEQFNQWYAVYTTTALRDGFTRRGHSYIQGILQSCQKHDTNRVEAKLYLSSLEGKINGGIIVLFTPVKGLYLFGASLREKGISASYSLQDRAIQDACKRGCKIYDFYGVPSKNGDGAYLQNLLLFKQSFGGYRMDRIGSVDFVYKKWLYKGFSFAERMRMKRKRSNHSKNYKKL